LLDASLRYLSYIEQALQEIKACELDAINQAGDLIGESIAEGRVFHIFGSGHSELIAYDCFARAGGLACANKITDPSRGLAERVEGYILTILERYDLRAGEVLIIISNSGRNPAPIDACLYGQSRGLKVVAITSLSHSKAVSSRHSSGKKLYELADLVIDTHGPLGDASVELGSGMTRVSPVSTALGVVVLNMMLARAAARALELGGEVPVLRSLNLDGTEEHNRKLWLRYRNRVGPLEF
jgi:uncharacterized phosphosugar-binding protein